MSKTCFLVSLITLVSITTLIGCSVSDEPRLVAPEDPTPDGGTAGMVVVMPPKKGSEESAEFRYKQQRAIIKRQEQDYNRQEKEMQDLRRQQFENQQLKDLDQR